jgi:Membrane protein involved in the export of O-antigen and teichoic acid
VHSPHGSPPENAPAPGAIARARIVIAARRARPPMKGLPADFSSRLLPIALAQIIGMACGVVGVKLMSHLVAPGDYGRYGLFLTATPLGMWVSHAGLIKFAARSWGSSPARNALLRELLAAYFRKLPLLLTAAAIVAYFIEPASWPFTFACLSLAASLLAAVSLAQAALQSSGKNWRDFAISCTASLTRTFFPPLFYVAAGGTVVALYAGAGIHATLAVIVAAFALRPYWSRPRPAATQLKPVYDGPLFIILSIVGWIMFGLNRWILAATFGTTETGYFTLASNIATPSATLFGAVFTQYFQPAIFRSARESIDDRRRLASRIDFIALAYCVVALLGVLALRWIAPFLVGHLIDENYRPAIDYIIPAGCFLTAMLTASFYHMLLLAGDRESACLPVDSCLAAVLAAGCLASATWGGGSEFRLWLCLSPLAPWLIARPLARRYLFAAGNHRNPVRA